MLASEGVERWNSAPFPEGMVDYDEQEHAALKDDIMTGLVGALLQLKLDVITARDIGVELPIAVINIDGIGLRILVDPVVEKYKTHEGQELYKLTALNNKGSTVTIDTYVYRYDDEYDRLTDAIEYIRMNVR